MEEGWNRMGKHTHTHTRARSRVEWSGGELTGLLPRMPWAVSGGYFSSSSIPPYVLPPAARRGRASIFNTARPSWHFISFSKATEEEEVDRERRLNFDVELQRKKRKKKEKEKKIRRSESLWERQRRAANPLQTLLLGNGGFQSEVPGTPRGGSLSIAAGVSGVMGRGGDYFHLNPIHQFHFTGWRGTLRWVLARLSDGGVWNTLLLYKGQRDPGQFGYWSEKKKTSSQTVWKLLCFRFRTFLASIF